MSNTNSKNLTSCNSCYSCYYCNSCNSCDSCYSCNSCNSCNYCNSCNSCDSCYYCNSCNSCYYCNSCYSCNSCDYCDSCNSCYSCDYSKGLKMSEYMLFCVGEGKYESKGEGYQKNYRVFNKQVTKDEYEAIDIPSIKLPTATWVDKKSMSKQEKDENSSYKETGGYLRVLSYEDAWAEWWRDASKKDKQQFLDLPHFDADIFKQITGVDVDVSTNPKEIEQVIINGEEYVKKQ